MKLNRVLAAAAATLGGVSRGRVRGQALVRQAERDRAEDDYRRGTLARGERSDHMEAMRLALQARREAQEKDDRAAIGAYMAEHAPDLASLGETGLQEHFRRTRPPEPRAGRNPADDMIAQAEGQARYYAATIKDATEESVDQLLAREFPRLAPGRRRGIAAEAVAWARLQKSRNKSSAFDVRGFYEAMGMSPPTTPP